MSRASDADASSRPDGEITQLLEACSNGEPEALDRLMPLVYDDLRAIAHRRLVLERADHAGTLFSQSGSIEVADARFGDMKGTLTGTFSGEIARMDGSESITVTDGRFEVELPKR